MKKTFSPVNPASIGRVGLEELQFKPNTGTLVYVSQNMSGKMQGIPSISTSVLLNPICKSRSNVSGSICQKCFAQSTVSRYDALRRHLEDNYHVLNSRTLDPSELPHIYSDICRLEAFGDLASVTQAINYIRIAKKSPWCTFAIWTKNPAYLDRAIREEGKPGNLVCVLSSNYINRVDDGSRWPWADHIFTVYSPDYIAENAVEINCGGHKCRECMRCYTVGNAEYHISERLK